LALFDLAALKSAPPRAAAVSIGAASRHPDPFCTPLEAIFLASTAITVQNLGWMTNGP
jgi:hypothetical protein